MAEFDCRVGRTDVLKEVCEGCRTVGPQHEYVVDEA